MIFVVNFKRRTKCLTCPTYLPDHFAYASFQEVAHVHFQVRQFLQIFLTNKAPLLGSLQTNLVRKICDFLTRRKFWTKRVGGGWLYVRYVTVKVPVRRRVTELGPVLWVQNYFFRIRIRLFRKFWIRIQIRIRIRIQFRIRPNLSVKRQNQNF